MAGAPESHGLTAYPAAYITGSSHLMKGQWYEVTKPCSAVEGEGRLEAEAGDLVYIHDNGGEANRGWLWAQKQHVSAHFPVVEGWIPEDRVDRPNKSGNAFGHVGGECDSSGEAEAGHIQDALADMSKPELLKVGCDKGVTVPPDVARGSEDRIRAFLRDAIGLELGFVEHRDQDNTSSDKCVPALP